MSGRGQQVEPELGHGGEQREGCGERQEGEREEQRGEVGQVAPVERRRVVAALECGGSGRREMGHDDERRHESRAAGQDSDRCSRASGRGSGRRTRRPSQPPRGHVLLRGDRRRRQQREGPQASLVEVPPGKEEERARERDRMEVAHRQPLHRRIEQICDGERSSRPFQVEVLACEPVDRDRAGRDGDRLHDEQELGRWPHPPERSERGQDRVEMRAETGDLLAVDIGDREEVAVCGRPDGLRHVSEVEAAAAEGAMPENRRGAEDARECGRREPDDGGWLHRATSCSTRPRQRSPSTSSLACVSVGGKAARADAPRKLRLAGEATHGCRQRLRVAGRDEQRAVAVPQQLAGRRRVGGDQRRPAGKCLKRLVRDHAAPPSRTSRRRRARTPRAGSPPAAARSRPTRPTRRSAAARAEARRAGRCRRPGTGSPARAVQPPGSSRARAAGSACRRRARGRFLRGCQPGRKSRSSAPTKQTASRSSGKLAELGQVACVLLRVCDDEVGAPERDPIERRRKPAAGEPAPKRPRSSTRVSWSDTSGLKSTGLPRAIRLAAGRSKWPG